VYCIHIVFDFEKPIQNLAKSIQTRREGDYNYAVSNSNNSIISRFTVFRKKYSRQFWVIFWGQMISVVGTSLTWPFLTIYLRENFGLPLTTITFLISLESVMTVLSTILAGPIMDRSGRKPVMVASALVSAGSFVALAFAKTLPAFIAIMVLRGLFTQLYRVGTNTMVTDLVSEENRYEAFSLTRTSANIGFAIGPAIGGFIAAVSIQVSMSISAAVLAIVTVISIFGIKETLPKISEARAQSKPDLLGGYGKVVRDKPFIAFIIADICVTMGMVNMFNLLSVYGKENFGVPESQYGFIMTVNAVMAATLQLPVTGVTRKQPQFVMLALGAVFYAIGLSSVALGDSFIDFVISMVVMTIGELILQPVAMSVVASLSPVSLRGRYMSLYSLTMGAARGIGPLIGGLLNDNISPASIWYGAGIMAMVSAAIFVWMHRNRERLADMKPAEAEVEL
jgi:MFS family permease